MPTAPWDNPDLDDYESRQAEREGAGDWVEEQAGWHLPHALDNYGSDGYEASEAAASATQHESPELAAPTARLKRFRIIHNLDETRYLRTEGGWLRGGLPVTLYTLAARLEQELEDRLRRDDRAESDPRELISRAWLAQALQHADRTEDLTTRALRALVGPPDPSRGGEVVPSAWRAEALAAAAMLCSALRQQHESGRALEETELFADAEYAPLMTSRAAALCDLNRWEDGRKLSIRARDLQDSPEVTRLLGRIDRHFIAERDGRS